MGPCWRLTEQRHRLSSSFTQDRPNLSPGWRCPATGSRQHGCRAAPRPAPGRPAARCAQPRAAPASPPARRAGLRLCGCCCRCRSGHPGPQQRPAGGPGLPAAACGLTQGPPPTLTQALGLGGDCCYALRLSLEHPMGCQCPRAQHPSDALPHAAACAELPRASLHCLTALRWGQPGCHGLQKSRRRQARRARAAGTAGRRPARMPPGPCRAAAAPCPCAMRRPCHVIRGKQGNVSNQAVRASPEDGGAYTACVSRNVDTHGDTRTVRKNDAIKSFGRLAVPAWRQV